jgi:hypothetical protein
MQRLSEQHIMMLTRFLEADTSGVSEWAVLVLGLLQAHGADQAHLQFIDYSGGSSYYLWLKKRVEQVG